MNLEKNKINQLEETDEVKNYYENLIKKISEDWQNNKHELAIERLKEELDQPYIPYNFEELMSDMLFSYERELKFSLIDKKIKEMSMDEMIGQIFVNGKFNVFIFELFVQKFTSKIDDKYFPIFQLWLQSSDISNEDKFLILDSLASEGIDKDFVFYNKNVDHDVVVNTLSYRESDYLKKYNLTLKKIEQIIEKDQVVANFAKDVLECCANYYFPEFPFKSVDSFANAIINIISKFMNLEDVNITELNHDEKIIYKIIEYIEKQENLN
ncbi:MAG: DUF3196 family protein [Candidatus Ureaplasma intestinipullorum]|uniref:DUF3196 family protein n=1 Tax=Candidatus Ureaplasma intestinipullorum TaxID=2838770 RepID=A0A9E2KW89_9BACT|nr:DUF3196 family protein [Candidatus Ureaplasma intestinipullorum]